MKEVRLWDSFKTINEYHYPVVCYRLLVTYYNNNCDDISEFVDAIGFRYDKVNGELIVKFVKNDSVCERTYQHGTCSIKYVVGVFLYGRLYKSNFTTSEKIKSNISVNGRRC